MKATTTLKKQGTERRRTLGKYTAAREARAESLGGQGLEVLDFVGRLFLQLRRLKWFFALQLWNSPTIRRTHYPS